MKTLRTVSIILASFALLIIFACCDDTFSPVTSSFSTPTGTGYLRKSDKLWILNLEGNYTDMGRQYGALLKDDLLDLFPQMDNAIGFDRTKGLLKELEGLMDDRERHLLEGMASETGLTFDEHEFLNASLCFMYTGIGCSAFSATGSQTESGFTVAGRNLDNPRGEITSILSGQTILLIYNPREQFTGNTPHWDNSVAVVTEIGWIYGLTNLNSKGIYLEYNNGTTSIPIDLNMLGKVIDGLHQNLYAAFDSDSLEDVHERLSGPAAIATITQVADKDRVWHYERSPYENSRRIFAGEAKGAFYYNNQADMDIFTNHFFFSDWLNQINNDPSKFNKDHDTPSKTIARLINLQNLADQFSGWITPEKMKEIMTTPLLNDGTGGPFIGWDLANNDVTYFTTVTDIASKMMHIYPYLNSGEWVTVDLGAEFR